MSERIYDETDMVGTGVLVRAKDRITLYAGHIGVSPIEEIVETGVYGITRYFSEGGYGIEWLRPEGSTVIEVRRDVFEILSDRWEEKSDDDLVSELIGRIGSARLRRTHDKLLTPHAYGAVPVGIHARLDAAIRTKPLEKAPDVARAPGPVVNADEQRAVGLYAVLARDASDFIDMVRSDETSNETLDLLHKLLTTENPKHDADTRELNKIGASIVAGEIDLRTQESLGG